MLPIPAHPLYPLYMIYNALGGFETYMVVFPTLMLKNFLFAGIARISCASSSGTPTIPIWRPWSCLAMRRYLSLDGLVWSDIPTTWDRSSCSGPGPCSQVQKLLVSWFGLVRHPITWDRSPCSGHGPCSQVLKLLVSWRVGLVRHPHYLAQILTQKKIQNPCYQIRYCTNVISTGAILVSFCLQQHALLSQSMR
jgi:hypothetical protein